MVDWQSPEVLAQCQLAAEKINLFSFGVYSWHFLTTLRYVEYLLIVRKLRWRWVYVFYLGARYLLLVALLAIQISINQIGFEVTALAGSIAITCASGNLLVRTIVIWRANKYVVGLLVLAGLGHWIAMVVVTLVPVIKSANNFSPSANGPVAATDGAATPFYLYTIVIDLLILVFTVYGLLRRRATHVTPLWKTLYTQGVLYFAVTLAVNVPLVVFTWLRLNQFMAGILSGPSLVISVIASSRAVTSLFTFKECANSVNCGEKPTHNEANNGALSTDIRFSLEMYHNPDDVSTWARKTESTVVV